MLLLVLWALLLGSVGSLVAIASTTQTADACSIAGPWAEVSQSTNLRPGQEIVVGGTGFYDLIFHDDPPQLDSTQPERPALCDFDLIPMENITIVWYGDVVQKLALASGPEFKLVTHVPDAAGPGKATILVGEFEVGVSVGPVVEPPPPCPLVTGTVATTRHDCPDPWPCPEYFNGRTEPATDVAPGFLPPCPEPCVDYAHTTDDGTTYDYKWDCPDPCGYPQAAPGASSESGAIWCPPPPPDPCPVYVHGEAQAEPAIAVYCPDPCDYDVPVPATAEGSAAFWCPPPDPCPVYAHGDTQARPDIEVCPPPDPCPLYASQGPTDLAWCPDPCRWYGSPEVQSNDAEAAYYCPDPCGPYLHGEDLRPCPEPCPVYFDDAPQTTRPAMPSYCPDPCLDTSTAAVWCPPYDEPHEGDITPLPVPEPIEPTQAPVEPTDTATVPVTGSNDAEVAFASTPDEAEVAPVEAPPAVAIDQPNRPIETAPVETPAIATAPVETAPVQAPAIKAAAPIPPAADRTEPMAAAVTQRITRSVSALFAALFG